MGLLLESKKRKVKINSYNHQSLEWRRNFCRFLLHQIGFRFLAKIDRIEGVENVPLEGPGIVMINHIAFIDPIVVLANLPRNVVPLGKIEAFHYPVVGIFPRIWDAIPVMREGFDRNAIRRALSVLAAGEMLLIAPEGTRNPGLKDAREGVSYLGSRSGAPVIPVVITGSKGFPSIKPSQWKESGALVQIGAPFRFRSDLKRPDREELKRMTDESMYILARMLPEELRGEYSELSKATTELIEFI